MPGTRTPLKRKAAASTPYYPINGPRILRKGADNRSYPQSCPKPPGDQRVNIYYGLTQVILNQEYNIVKAVKNVIIKIKKDTESKEQENTFADIRKLSKITYKVNKIKAVRDIIKKEQGDKLLEGPCELFYTYYTLKSIRIFINQVKRSQVSREDILEIVNNAILSRLELQDFKDSIPNTLGLPYL